jgi:hypothetical protein
VNVKAELTFRSTEKLLSAVTATPQKSRMSVQLVPIVNWPEPRGDHVFARPMRWRLTVILIAPGVTWPAFIAPGWP